MDIPEIRATLDGQPVLLRFTMRSVMNLEKELGIKVGAQPISDNNPFLKGFTGYCALLWAALLHERPRWTIDEASALLEKEFRASQERFSSLLTSLERAYVAFFPSWELAPANGAAKNAQRAASTGPSLPEMPPAAVSPGPSSGS